MGRVTPTQPREAGRLTVSRGASGRLGPRGAWGPPAGVRTRLGETGAWRRSGAALASGPRGAWTLGRWGVAGGWGCLPGSQAEQGSALVVTELRGQCPGRV